MKQIIGIGILVLLAIAAYMFIPRSETASNDSQGGYGGLTVTEAQNLAESRGVAFRVVELDGQPQPATKDRRPGRVNAEVADNTVIGYTIEN